MKKTFLIVLGFMSVFVAKCYHIVGGELFYNYAGNNVYHITLKLYKDCYCTNCAPYSDPEYLTIFDSAGNVFTQLAMPRPDSIELPLTFATACSASAIPVCIDEADYVADITLPPVPGGYTIVYQRCCRNAGLLNIAASTGVGATFTCTVPGTAYASSNNSARFNNLPPLYVCLNAPLAIDYSATDPDGDLLVYSLCDPYDGADATCPDPSPNAVGCPTIPNAPPYAACVYSNPYSSSNFTNSTSANNLSINPQTGLLTGVPNTVGLFDITVCVSEYRNGHLLNVLRRDFQFNVAPCALPIANIPPVVNSCNSLTVNFSPEFYNPYPSPLSFMWDFGVSASTTDTSSQPSPTFTYPDTGTYLVQLVATDSFNGYPCHSDTSRRLIAVYPVFTAGFSDVVTCQNDSVSFTDETIASPTPANSWLWRFGDGATSNAQNPTHTYSPGTYTVEFIEQNAQGCLDSISRQLLVCSSDTTGIVNYLSGKLSLFPNPANDYVTLSGNMSLYQPVSVDVFNQIGQLVSSQNLAGNTINNTISTAELPNGIYELNVTTAGKTVMHNKLIIVR